MSPQHRDVGEAVPAKRDRQRKIYEYLARIVDGPRFPPGGECCGYGLVEAGPADRFDQQH